MTVTEVTDEPADAHCDVFVQERELYGAGEKRGVIPADAHCERRQPVCGAQVPPIENGTRQATSPIVTGPRIASLVRSIPVRLSPWPAVTP